MGKTVRFDSVKSVFRVSRFCFTNLRDASSVQVHGFSDSSTESNCAVVYLRFTTFSGVVLGYWRRKRKLPHLKSCLYLGLSCSVACC